MARPAGDRRRNLRYEIVGRLAGSLEAVETLPILNLSRGGVCVRASRPLPVESTAAARLVSENHVFDFHVRVRHVSQTDPDDAGDRYLVGLEFIGVSSSTLDEIERQQLRGRPAGPPARSAPAAASTSLPLG